MNRKDILNIKNIPKELLISLTESLRLREHSGVKEGFEDEETLKDQYNYIMGSISFTKNTKNTDRSESWFLKYVALLEYLKFNIAEKWLKYK